MWWRHCKVLSEIRPPITIPANRQTHMRKNRRRFAWRIKWELCERGRTVTCPSYVNSYVTRVCGFKETWVGNCNSWNSLTESPRVRAIRRCPLTVSVASSKHFCSVITGRICRRQLCRYFVYSRADFGVFRPVGATRCTDQGEIWYGGADRRSAAPCQISPWSV